MIRIIKEVIRGEEWHRLPVEKIIDSSTYGSKVEILTNGYVKYIYSGLGNIAEMSQEVKNAIQDYFNSVKQDYFWRFTFNKNEIELVNTGKINQSVDHSNGKSEKGLSVAAHTGYNIFGYPYCYKVVGDIISYGADGEPVLDLKSLKPISKLMKSSSKAVGEAEKQNKLMLLKKMGWTEDQYRAAMQGIHFVNNISEYENREQEE